MAPRLLAILFVAAFAMTQCAQAQETDPVDVTPDVVDGSDLCTDPACSPDGPLQDAAQRYTGSISLRSLGFVPRVNREILAPDEDEALAWLGPSHLLVAFNPHLLVPRHGASGPCCTVRIIRAALFDVSTRGVERTVEWHVVDRRQFLRPMPGNRVLVHVGDELRVYGAGLRLEQRLTLAAPLAFVRVSPDGRTFALGLIAERHSPQVHAQLAAAQNADPEEDVRVLVLNDRFNTVSSSMSTSGVDPPALLNGGLVTLQSSSGKMSQLAGGYDLQLRIWNNDPRPFAHFRSACPPELSSLAPDLLFLVTCNPANQSREFRVLRPDGKTVLHGRSSLNQLGHAARGGGRNNSFAIRIFSAGSPVLPGEPFHPADLAWARLAIYSPRDGKRLFTARIRDPAASLGGYAVSTDGQVAILAQDAVDLFAMP